jgi:hypothetical protein
LKKKISRLLKRHWPPGIWFKDPAWPSLRKEVAERAGASFAVAVSNCTAALHLSLLALDVRPGDMVVVTAYSWIATANVIEQCGAQPVFIDILPDTFNMDPSILESTLDRLMGNPKLQTRKSRSAGSHLRAHGGHACHHGDCRSVSNFRLLRMRPAPLERHSMNVLPAPGVYWDVSASIPAKL